MQSAVVASVVANVNRGKKRRPYTPADFMPKWDRGQPQTAEQQKHMILAMNAAFGGTRKR